MSAYFDHIMVACADLRQSSDWFEANTVVRPVFGGKHTGRGTQNALVGLGNNQYLELIAPDPDQKDVIDTWDQAMRDRYKTAGRIVLWIALTPDVAKHSAAGRATAGDLWPLCEPFPFRRETPEGQVLEWSLSTPQTPTGFAAGGCLPWLSQFFGPDELHPAATAPKGLELVELRVYHPDPDAITRALAAVGIDGPVSKISVRRAEGDTPYMTAVIKTPKGEITFTEVTAAEKL